MTAIGRALGLPKSSAHRLLASLARRGLVEQDDRGRYRPGIALVGLGLGVLEREPLVEAARPTLAAEADAVGETFFLVAARSRELVVLDKAEGTGFLRAAPRVGTAVPVRETAVGKLYVAFAPGEVGEPGAASPSATADAALARAVALARRRGFAVNRDEWIPGLSVVAAPVRRLDRMVGALAVAAASPRFDDLGESALAARVVAAADAIGARLGGVPGHDQRVVPESQGREEEVR